MVSLDYSTEPGAAQVVSKDDTGPIVLYYVRSVDRGLSGPIYVDLLRKCHQDRSAEFKSLS